jgi:acetyl-CoA acetyltransferase
MPPCTSASSRRCAIVGIGETDYDRDYQAARARPAGYVRPTVAQLGARAFARALEDAGLKPSNIDGLALSLLTGRLDVRLFAAQLGLEPRYCVDNGNIMAGPLPRVCADIAMGHCDTVAMVFAVGAGAGTLSYGATGYSSDQAGTPASYYYYQPWGWTSQAAHWALMARHYQIDHGTSEADLGAVAIQLRENAALSPNAIMRSALTPESYLASRYIVRPLRLFDMCLVNDGAVCLIVRRADRAGDMPYVPVLVAGWGEAKVGGNKMHAMVRDKLAPQMQEAGRQALDMAGLALADIGHFEGYDAASIHLVNQLEGYGFAAPGQALQDFAAGEFGPNGRLGVNTAGGMMSGSYMHGWNQVVEVVRQLRHVAGDRQRNGVRTAMSSLVQTDQAHPIVFTRGP